MHNATSAPAHHADFLPVLPMVHPQVFRGSRVTIREHPYIVSVRRNFVHYLTGSLLTKNVVLSVAHPLYRVPIDELAVVSGENYSDRGTIVLTAVLLIIHKQFDPYTLKADLALIRFYEDIVVRSSTKTIELVSPTAAIFGTRAFVTGWGRCDFTGKELCLPRSSLYGPDERSDPMLRTISFVITERNVHCDVYNQHSNPLVPGQLCTGVAREMDVLTPCMAVPGAPLVVWGKLAGVLSWGLGCGYANDLPLIYSDVQYYGSWLTKTLKMLNNITQQDLNELFLATKSSKLSTWLSKTRLSKPLRQPISENQEMQSIKIDKDLSAFDAKLYDIRDFLYDRKFHVKKKKIYKRMKATINATTPNVKLINYFQLPALKLEPFLSNKAIYFNQDQEEKNDDDSD